MSEDYKKMSDKAKKTKSRLKDEELLQQAKEDFKEAQHAFHDIRRDAKDDLEFAKLGKQWDQAVMSQRNREGRPCLTINRLPTFIRQVTNEVRQSKSRIRVHPVDSGADIRTSKIYNGLIRNIETISRADIAYDTSIDSAASCSFGYVRVVTDYCSHDTFDQDILIERIANPFVVYGDPHSKSGDGSDWNTCFVTEMLTTKQFKQQYPKAEKVSVSFDDSDADNYNEWFEENGVRIAEYWVRTTVEDEVIKLSNSQVVTREQYEGNKDLFDIEGLAIEETRHIKRYKVKQYVITGAEVLEENDWHGKYIPIIPVYGEEVNVEGKTHLHSLIRQAKDAQRNYNYWRSAATELVALAPKAPFIGKHGFADKDPRWHTAHIQNHPFLEYASDLPPQRQPFAGMPAGALQESLNASDDLKNIIGIQDASLGKVSNETSGKAIIARQRQGDNATFHFADNMARAIRQVGAVLIDLIPHIYSQERIIRIIGDDDVPVNVPINQRVVERDGTYIPVSELEEEVDPDIVQVFDLTNGKYDLVVTSGPNYATKRQESATQMMDLVKGYPDAAPIIGDLIVGNLDWDQAPEIAERLRAINPVLQKQQAQENPQENVELQMKQQEAQLEMQKVQADLQMKQMDMEMKKIDMEKARIELQKANNTNQIY